MALVGLSRAYFTHISSQLPPLDELREQAIDDTNGVLGLVDKRVYTRLACVPSTVVNSFAYPDAASKHLVTQLLQEYILPKTSTTVGSKLSQEGSDKGSQDSSDASPPAPPIGKGSSGRSPGSIDNETEECRSTAFLFMWLLLKKPERDALRVVLTFKAGVRRALKTFLDLRAIQQKEEREKGSTRGNKEEKGNAGPRGTAAKLRQAMFMLSKEWPVGDKKTSQSHCEKLHNVKDKIVFRLIKYVYRMYSLLSPIS